MTEKKKCLQVNGNQAGDPEFGLIERLKARKITKHSMIRSQGGDLRVDLGEEN